MATGDGRIDVYIHANIDNGNANQNSSGEQEESNNTATATAKATPTNTQGQVSITQMKGISSMTMVAQGMFNYATSNVGKYTGNSHYQNITNTIQQGVNTVAMAIVNPYLALGNLALQGVTYALNYSFERKMESISVNQARARAGYSSTDTQASKRSS